MIHTRVDRVDKEEAIIHMECQGDVQLLDVLTAMITPFAPGIEPTMPVLWNLQRGELLVSPHDLNKVPRDVVDLANEIRPSGKTAWVARTARGEAIINLLYEQYPWQATWQTFATLEAATAWCKDSRQACTGRLTRPA